MRSAAGLGLATALAGAALGVAGIQFVRRRPANVGWFVAAGAAGLWCSWAAAPPGDWRGMLLIAFTGFALLGSLAGARGLDATGFTMGLAAGFIGCSAGIFGIAGLLPAMGVGLPLAVIGGLLPRAPAPEGAEASLDVLREGKHWTAVWPGCRILLAAAAGAATVNLVRAYLPAVRSVAYSTSDLAIAFCLGVGLFQTAFRGRSRAATLLSVGAFGCVLISLVCGYSFFLYPDLVMSESAALQTPASLLVPERVFPLWALAFVLGLASGPAWVASERAAWFVLPLTAAGSGAAWAGLLAGSYRAAYVLPVALAVLAIAPAALVRRTKGQGIALSAGALVLTAVAAAWSLTANVHSDWAGLRATLATYLAQHAGTGAEPRQFAPTDVRLNGSGLVAALSSPWGRAEFVGGNLVDACPSGGLPAIGTKLPTILGLALCPSPGRMALVGPTTHAAVLEAERLAGGAQVRVIGVWGAPEEGNFDAIICDSQALSAAANPLAVLSVESLGRLKARLNNGGVLSIWFPAGWADVDAVESALASLREAFPAFYVFLNGQDAVLVATSASSFRFSSIAALQPRVADAGFWDPTDLLSGYVGDAGELAALAHGAAPYRLSQPVRPPSLARNLTGRTSPVALAALLQHRLAGPESLLSLLAFESDNQRAVALRGFADIYGEHTRAIVQNFGLTTPQQQQELLAFFEGPLARLDLFAPKEEGRVAGIASALSAFGLRNKAMEVLKKAIEAGNDTFALRLRLALIMEGANRGVEALRQYQQALVLQPDSALAMGRMAALLLAMGRQREAADELGKMIEKQPTNVKAILMLATLYAGPLKRPKDAADLAVRVLDMEPGNAAAQDILALCRPTARAGGAR